MPETPLASLRQEYLCLKKRSQECFLQERNPRTTLEELTAVVDQLMVRLSRQHLSEGICLLAVGGYGRREMYPCSDVDLLVLHEPGAETEEAVKSILHDLWDLKLQVGHRVWTLEDLERQEMGELDLVLSLLDGRLLAGDRRLGETLLEDLFPAYVRAHQHRLIADIIDLTRARHRSFDNTIYQLEPDLKEAPGGLRDHLVAGWLSRLRQVESVTFPYRGEEVEGAREFLMTLRILMHFLTGQPRNQLTHRLQEKVVAQLNGSSTGVRSQVERLMQTYFLNARILHRYCRNALEFRKSDSSRMPAASAVPRLVTASRILEHFRRGVLRDEPLSDATRSAVAQALTGVRRTLHHGQVRDLVRDLFKPRPGLYRMLGELYELGLLELLFPEFTGIKALVIRDFYHRYTVDEHTLLAIKCIEDLVSPEQPSDGRFAGLLAEEPAAELLTLALLLHDVGKSRPGEHPAQSAKMAAAALRRFRFAKHEVETVVFLIRHHLAMSRVILRRDLEDPEVVRRFADLVRSPDRLRLLCLLTFADIKAVAPGTLNDWKKDLLWQLYVSTYQELTLGYGEVRIAGQDIGEKLRAGLPKNLDARGFEEFLHGFPRRYLNSTSPEEIYEHYRLASRLSAESPIQLRLTAHRSHYELCVVTPDRYHLFAKIVGLLAYFDMNILRGFAFANRRNTVLDLFQFTDTRKVFRMNPEEKERFRSLLVDAIQDRIEVEKLVQGKERSPVFQTAAPPFEPTIYFAEDASQQYSIMEIVAPDSIGLLYRIGRRIAAARCNIELVLISTEGERAVDVFYLSYQEGKLPGALQEQLVESIRQSIGEVHETGDGHRPTQQG